jgi:hypothetical protein
MSNPYEPEMTKAHWAKRPEKGTLYLEYPICGRRIDGLIVLDDRITTKDESREKPPSLSQLTKDNAKVIVLQTKRNKLGMGVAGQTIISKTLLEQAGVEVVAAVAICLEIDDKILGALRKHDCEAVVEVDPKDSCSRMPRS